MGNVEFLLFFLNLYKIGYMIIMPIICIIGFFLNIICWIVLLNRKLKEKLYFYLAIKVFLGVLLLSLGALTPYVICLDCATYNTYSSMFINLVVYKFLRNSLYLFATIIEILITFDRYFILKSRTKFNVTLKNKILLVICGIVSLISFSPTLFAEKIVKTKHFLNEYTLIRTKFGQHKSYSIYLTCVNFISNILTIFILLPFNIMVLVKYRKFIRKKKVITRLIISPIQKAKVNSYRSNMSQKRFTKMILVVSFLFIFSRLGEASVRIFNILYDVNDFRYFDLYSTVLNIFVEFNTYIIFSLDFFIYYIFNKPFRDCLKNFFSYKRSNFSLN